MTTILTIITIAAFLAAFTIRYAMRSTQHPRLHRLMRKFFLLPLTLRRLTGRTKHADTSSSVQFINIGEGSYEHGHKSYLPDATTSARYLLYKRGSDTDHCAITGAGDDPLGPSDDQADSTTTPITINILGATKGTVRVVTDGTVNDGDYVKCGATGQVTQAATTNLTFGRAVIPTDCSKAAGDIITIIPTLPAKYAF